MKKLICMLLALVLMMGALVLPASAEEAAGEIYKLPGGYSDFIGMGGGVIVCGKTVYDPVFEMDMTKYGAIDYTGRVILPFEYDIASAPNDDGDFFVSTVDYENLSINYLYVSSYLVNKSGELLDLNAYFKFGTNESLLPIYYSNGLLTIMYGFESLESAFAFGVGCATYDFEAEKYIGQFGAVDMYSNVCKDDEYWAFTGDGALYIKPVDNRISSDKVEIEKISENDYITPIILDDGLLYYLKTDYAGESSEVFRYNIKTGAKENMTELYDCVLVYTSMISDCAVANSGKYIMQNADGKYAYVDDYNDINTGYIFDDVLPEFSDGYFCAVIDDEFTYYTTDGKPTDRYFAENINFSSGTSFVTDEKGDTYAIDTEFNRVSDDAIVLDSETSMYEYKDGVLVTLGNNFEFYAYTTDADYSIFGDVNGDEKVDVADIIKLKSIVMAEEELPAADLNADTKVDVQDIITLKALIMAI